jgi:hypothetical protein
MRFTHVGLAMTLSMLVAAGEGEAVDNTRTTLVLHAVETDFGPCTIADPCAAGGAANVSVEQPGESHAIYLIARNHEELTGVLCAFDWDESWTYLYSLWECPQGAVCELTPIGAGPIEGRLECTFDCVVGGAVVVGRLQMVPSSGCITVIERVGAFGTSVIDCELGMWAVSEGNRGSVCVGIGGHDACEPEPVPVERTTWGSVKSQYR